MNYILKLIVPTILLSCGYWFYSNYKNKSHLSDELALEAHEDSQNKNRGGKNKLSKLNNITPAQITRVPAGPVEQQSENQQATSGESQGPMSPEEFKVALQTRIKDLKATEEKCKATWEELESNGPIGRSVANWSDNVDDVKEVLTSLKKGNCFNDKSKRVSALFETENITEENFGQIKESLSKMDMSMAMGNRFKEMSVLRKVIGTLKTNKDPEVLANLSDILTTKAKNISNLYEGLMLQEHIKDIQKAGLLNAHGNAAFKASQELEIKHKKEIEEYMEKSPIDEQNPDQISYQTWLPIQNLMSRQAKEQSQSKQAILRGGLKGVANSNKESDSISFSQ